MEGVNSSKVLGGNPADTKCDYAYASLDTKKRKFCIMEEIKGEIKESVITEKEIEKRKEKIIKFLKNKTNWIVYAVLFVILLISTYIRTLPIKINSSGNPGLWDITTNNWTLGPDLDPFLFLRWAKYIAENGKLFLLDTMRSVPLADICSGETCNAINTAGEMKLLSYMIAWLSKFLAIFDKEITVTYAAVIFPVIMAVLAGIAFFLFSRKLFYKENKYIANVIALIATAFFVLIPSLLSRTIAGIPEKESAAFFFMFIGFYFFIEAFTSEKLKKGMIFGVLAGISTGLLGLVWGGIEYVFISVAGTILFSFLLGKIDEKRFYIFCTWVAGFVLTAMPFSARYSLQSLLTSLSTELIFMTLFILSIDFLFFKKKIIRIPEKITNRLPHQIISLIIGIILLIIISSVIFGISFIPDRINTIIDQTIQPISRGRFSITVAENRASYFSDWENEFGPIVFNIPLYFWMLIIGSVVLFSNLIGVLNKKEKRVLVFSYFVFLMSLIFSKYAPHPNLLDGEGNLSLLVYFGGVLFFFVSFGYFYYKRYKSGEFSVFKEFNFSYILYFIILTMTIIGARGAIRLIMVLASISPVAVAFLIVKSCQRYLKEKEDIKRLLTGIFVLLVLISSIFTLWVYYNNSKNTAESYVPGIYQWQWQNAMEWVRENTSQDAVFAHWWDYGYWIQSIGERATILDGGNAVGYWNFFMGRHVLTGTSERDALDFLYAHNGTHLLIDSTDIGKYAAFSSIGSNGTYDRYAWIPTVFMDDKQTQETNNETLYVYSIGTALDEDVLLEEDGKEILLPKKKAIVGAVVLKEGKGGEIKQPTIFFVYNEKQYQMPLRYIYINEKLYDFKEGMDAGIFVFPRVDVSEGMVKNIAVRGAAFYLSERVIHSQLARLYLFNEKTDYFKLVHAENSLINEDIKKQGLNMGEFAYYSNMGLQGPIKIWEISYPSDIKLNSTYLDMNYPEELETVNPGEY